MTKRELPVLQPVLLSGGPVPDGDRVVLVAPGVQQVRVATSAEDAVALYRLVPGRRERVGIRDLDVYAFEHSRRL